MAGSLDDVQLTSSPPGAEVYVDGVGRTPVEVAVSTVGSHTIELQLDGRTGRCEVKVGVSGMWVAFEIAMGLIPLAVDAATRRLALARLRRLPRALQRPLEAS